MQVQPLSFFASSGRRGRCYSRCVETQKWGLASELGLEADTRIESHSTESTRGKWSVLITSLTTAVAFRARLRASPSPLCTLLDAGSHGLDPPMLFESNCQFQALNGGAFSVGARIAWTGLYALVKPLVASTYTCKRLAESFVSRGIYFRGGFHTICGAPLHLHICVALRCCNTHCCMCRFNKCDLVLILPRCSPPSLPAASCALSIYLWLHAI